MESGHLTNDTTDAPRGMPRPASTADDLLETLPTDELVALVHHELVRVATRLRPRGAVPGPFDPSSMISKAYLRLCGDGSVRWNSRGHFLGAAARAMRRIVVDEARARAARKRPPDRARIHLTEIVDLRRAGNAAASVDVVRLDALIDELAALRPRCAEVVNLRFFAGLSIEETAHVLRVDTRTVNRDWLFARTWLFDRLQAEVDSAGEASGA